MVPTCSSGILTNMLPHRNAMPQTQDMTPHHITVYRDRPVIVQSIMWNVTLEYTTTHFNVSGQTRSRKSFPELRHIPANDQLYGGFQSEAQ